MPVKKRKTRSVAEAEGTITSIVFGSSDVDKIAPNIDSDDTASISTPNVNDINSSANSTDTYTEKVNELKKGQNRFYSAENLNEEVLRMERGILKKIFFSNCCICNKIQIGHCLFLRLESKSINFENQILITLMKLKQNYPNLHLPRLFSCSKTTIANIILTFIHILHKLFFEDIMSHIPSRFKSKISEAFVHFPNC